jgi:hypothetical protein
VGYDLKWGINKEGVFWSFSSTLIVIYILQNRFLNLIEMENPMKGKSRKIYFIFIIYKKWKNHYPIIFQREKL